MHTLNFWCSVTGKVILKYRANMSTWSLQLAQSHFHLESSDPQGKKPTTRKTFKWPHCSFHLTQWTFDSNYFSKFRANHLIFKGWGEGWNHFCSLIVFFCFLIASFGKWKEFTLTLSKVSSTSWAENNFQSASLP